MCVMTSAFFILHFKGTIMFTHFFLMREWPSGKVSVTVSKFNAYFPHITGCFYLQMCAVFSLTNVNATTRLQNSTNSEN